MYSTKTFHETYWCSSSIACQDKGIDSRILGIFTFNGKNPLYLPIISTLQFFWRSKWSRSNPISHKTIWHIPNIKNSEFKIKNMPTFSKPLYFSFNFLDNTSHKFWDQSPSPHYQCCLQVSETVSWHQFRCCYSANILQHWVGRKGLIYFCKVYHFRISRNFSRGSELVKWVYYGQNIDVVPIFYLLPLNSFFLLGRRLECLLIILTSKKKQDYNSVIFAETKWF